MMREPYFRDWAKPGPVATGAELVAVEPAETLDALCGDFRIFQLRGGHRFSTDDLLTAYYGTTWCPSAGSVLDLGSGIGSVGMVAAWRFPGARLVTVEAQSESVRLARKSALYNGLTNRADIREGDFRDPHVLAPEERFDLILGSPPYFPMSGGEHGDHPQKIACRFELRGDISDYAQIAAQHLAPGGVFACVFPIAPPFQRERVEGAARGAELCVVRWRKVRFKADEAPLLGLFAMTRANDLPPWFRSHSFEEPTLTIRTATGEVDPEYMAIKLSIGFPP